MEAKEYVLAVDWAAAVRTYTCTPELRFVTPPRTTTKPPRLQQKWLWRDAKTGGEEWRDVPLVVTEE